MNDSSPPVIPDGSELSRRSELLRFFRWLFSWRGVRRILILLAWTVSIIALLYGEENWRGRHAWNKYRRELEARGEQLDFKAFIPKSVPDEQNFAATPFVKAWFDKGINSDLLWGDNYARADVIRPKPKSDRAGRRLADLVAFQMAFDAIQSGDWERHKEFQSYKLDPESRAKAAPAVLNGLKGGEGHFTELRLASHRPYSRYAVNYEVENPWGILLPHLARLKGTCNRLQLRTCAELAAGQTENAFEDLKLLFYLADSLKEENLLISYLVRVACFQIATQPLWEGLAEHRWSEVQLQELQTRLQQDNFVADIRPPLGLEQAAAILTIDLVRRKRVNLSSLLDSHQDNCEALITDLVCRIMPRGWYDLEQLNYCRLFQGQFQTSFDAAERRVLPRVAEAKVQELGHALTGNGFSRLIHHRAAASYLLPALGNAVRRAAIAQTVADEAALACALERYRLANGQFPEKLDALVPRFVTQLPHDVLTGESYKYRRTTEGSFVLYSIGWDEKDDGGVPGKTLFDDKGDWVWESAPSNTL